MTALAFSGSSRPVLVSSADRGSVKLWELPSGRRLAAIDIEDVESMVALGDQHVLIAPLDGQAFRRLDTGWLWFDSKAAHDIEQAERIVTDTEILLGLKLDGTSARSIFTNRLTRR